MSCDDIFDLMGLIKGVERVWFFGGGVVLGLDLTIPEMDDEGSEN